MMLAPSRVADAPLGRRHDDLFAEPHGKPTLATLLEERGVLSTAHAVDVALQICDALSSAHDRGVVHGQLGLGCVRLVFTPEGGPRELEIVTLDPDEVTGVARVSAGPFLEPERELDAPADTLADIWALGGVLYSLLVGVAPALGAIEVPDGVPRGLAAVIHACLAVDPASRPQSADGVAEMIASFATWPPDHFARLAERRERREAAERSRQHLERRGLGDLPNVLDKLDEAALARAARASTTALPPARPLGLTTEAALERLMTAVDEGTHSKRLAERVELLPALPALVDFDDDDEEALPTIVQEETVRMEPIASPFVDLGRSPGTTMSGAPASTASAASPAVVFAIFALGAFAICLGAGYVGYRMSAKTPAHAVVAPAPAAPAAPAMPAAELEIPVFVPSALPEAPPVTPASLPEAKP